MDPLYQTILFSGIAGLTLVLGALIHQFLHIHNKVMKDIFIHWMVACGGGVLLSAVAFGLVPIATSTLNIVPAVISFLIGTVIFIIIDIILVKHGGTYAQTIGAVTDFLPEAIVLGASFAVNQSTGILLATFIALQNLPEGFNAHKELREMHRSWKIIAIFFILAIIGILAAITGFIYLHDNPNVISIILLAASGGILYLIFQDIAPEARLNGHHLAASGAAVGFIIGLIASTLIAH